VTQSLCHLPASANPAQPKRLHHCKQENQLRHQSKDFGLATRPSRPPTTAMSQAALIR